MRKFSIVLKLFVVFLALSSSALYSEAFLDVEGGAAFSGYNDVRIPADTGTPFSLVKDTQSDPVFALRLRVGYTFADRHTVTLLAAPLTVRGSGVLDRNVTYYGKTFAAGTRVDSQYRFDSYRLTYRYSFIKTDSLVLAAGLTGKVRSADIALMSDTGYAHRTDLGVVPLINFWAQWNFLEPFSLLLDVDALVSPYGRAEDGLLALQYHLNRNVAFRLGYRVLEGGADGGGNVYSFALFHYAMAGIRVSW
ncbi:MAG: hypothetical protein WCT14_11685 [Treponemataceae bacterium]